MAGVRARSVPAPVAFVAERAASGGIAPHVASRLSVLLDGDHVLMHAVADELSAAQLLGARPLPDPLPAVRAIRERAGRTRLTPAQRDLVLMIVLAGDVRLDELVSVTGVGADALLHLLRPEWASVESGRCTVTDPALRVEVLDSAEPVRTADAHAHLAELRAEQGDPWRAAWHRARGATDRAAEVVQPLLSSARRLMARGRSAEAYRAAVEAFDHALGDAVSAARAAVGAAALGAGWYQEAADWLGGIRHLAPARVRSRALGPRLVADTLRDGTVRGPDARGRPRGEDASSWRAWGRAAAFGAIVGAERGAVPETRAWLAEVREADRRSGADGALRDPVVALCRLLIGEDDPDEMPTGSRTAAFAEAVALVTGEDPAQGVSVLAQPSPVGDPVLAGAERTPLVRAYRAVLEVLALHWKGDIGAARERMVSAAFELPMAVPLAGLGAQLAGHLDIIAHGEPQAVAAALAAAAPPGSRIDRHQDLALQSYLAGDVDRAAAHVELWHDRGEHRAALPVGLLDEIGSAVPPHPREPQEAVAARRLARRVRGIDAARVGREHAELASAVRGIRSPYLRARLEALLGSMLAVHDDRAGARRHLRTARLLFDESGAEAWRRSVETRLARLGDGIVPAVPAPALDPLAACRAAWSDNLTERELEVAMLIVDGAQNRTIAEQLDLSVRTVEVHAGRAFAKLGVRSRVELTVLAHRTNAFA